MKYVIFLLLIVGFWGCDEEVVPKPDNLIPGEKMVDILYDLALINAAKSTNPGILEDNGIETMDYLYKKHGIDSLQFARSDLYYASRPLDYEAIYKRLELRLEREQEELEEARSIRTDSIRQIREAAREKQAALDSLK